ncbi:succinyl-diaminopimelate desuccinylase [Nesterenkonia marinintestina]|uniref:succinyl-diaminopimelate desuccinylase n=1 Tax=Nesterenkonia marinintestina TaxID=2979865 RepID=UPI0021C04A17|nr:succinyl-diaminopimelate desuccinylase [Nesterenkonia sp. GX14115]
MRPTDLEAGDVVALTEQLLAIRSVSGEEAVLADAVEAFLHGLDPGESTDSARRLHLHRDGDTVVARTRTGAPERIVLAGHLDTVPLPTVPGSRGTVPPSWEGETLYGRGATDMKGGVAVQLVLASDVAARLAELGPGEALARDVTWVFYDNEEVEAAKSGLGRVLRNTPDLLAADFAVLLEPTDGVVEGGCNGTCRIEVTVPGVASHSGRAWKGVNAIHAAAPVLTALAQYRARTVEVDGLAYREGLSAVGIDGGIAGNVVPDSCTVTVNYRFAPDKTEEQAHEHVREVMRGAGVDDAQMRVTDTSSGARPGLDHPAAAAFVEAVGGTPMPKYGWTDVARFSALGVPAVNFGPGSPLLAHTDDEHVSAEALRECLAGLRRWLG